MHAVQEQLSYGEIWNSQNCTHLETDNIGQQQQIEVTSKAQNEAVITQCTPTASLVTNLIHIDPQAEFF